MSNKLEEVLEVLKWAPVPLNLLTIQAHLKNVL